MIRIRSLLPASNAAFCTEWYWHCSARASLIVSRSSASRFLTRIVGWLGRRRKPLLLASLRDERRSLSEPAPPSPLQTTNTSPGPAPVTAEASGRAWGTLPPAGGLTVASAAGSGQ